MIGTNNSSSERLVTVQVLAPFRLMSDGRARETKVGDEVEVPMYLAASLASHNPPKVGPRATPQGRRSASA